MGVKVMSTASVNATVTVSIVSKVSFVVYLELETSKFLKMSKIVHVNLDALMVVTDVTTLFARVRCIFD